MEPSKKAVAGSETGIQSGPPTVPVTIQGTLMDPRYALLVVGTNEVSPPSTPADGLWFVVVDLTDLNIAANQVTTDSADVPSAVQPYVGNPNYLLILTSLGLQSNNLPQQALYDMLKSAGAGARLDRAEQVFAALGTGTIGWMSYILASTLEDQQGGGFEELSFDYTSIMTFQLLPITVNGKTIYTPIQTGS